MDKKTSSPKEKWVKVSPVEASLPMGTIEYVGVLTAGEVRQRLIEDKKYADEVLPKERTIRTKLNKLGFKPQKVAKSKPKKKRTYR